jgi:hypothetical protein
VTVLVPVGFVLLTVAVVLALARDRDAGRREGVRRAYAGLLVAGLLVAALTGLTVPPFADLHLYTPAAPATVTLADLRVVDADGAELRYDGRAIPPYTRAGGNWPARRLAAGDASDHRTLGGFLLDRANRHRDRVLTGGPARVVDAAAFPRHVLDDGWSRADIAGVGPFVGLRVYAVEVQYAPDGRRVDSRCERLVLELRTPAEGGGPVAVDAPGERTVCAGAAVDAGHALALPGDRTGPAPAGAGGP